MNKLIMLIGIPGSGKSTYAEKIAERESAVVISSDRLREELFGNVLELRRNSKLFGEMYKRALQYLSEGKNVVLDATNITGCKRKSILNKFKSYYKECYYIKTPLQKVLHQNRSRDRNVPENVIIRMYKILEEPDYNEGWDKINIVENSD